MINNSSLNTNDQYKNKTNPKNIWSYGRLVFLGLLLGSIIFNIIQFPTIENNITARIPAIILVVLGMPILIWHGFLWIKYSSVGEAVPILVMAIP